MPVLLPEGTEWFSVVECLDCGLGFVNPRPTLAAISRYYPASFYQDFEDQSAAHNKRYAREGQFIPPSSSVEPPTLLDVGCANGGFPKYMRTQGWVVEGVEVGTNAARELDFPVYRVPFPDIPVTKPRYDAITAWAVLEHVHDPMAHFRKAAEVLKPGGSLVFLVTDFESISSRYLYREDLPRHLYFFTMDTISTYLSRCGLVLERRVADDEFFVMQPVHWLRHHARRVIGKPPMTFAELPATRRQFVEARGLKSELVGTLAYAVCNPLTVVDRLTMPLYERWQKWRGTYGIVTYVARKPA
jgi:SAM-dependent methyltransferase